VSALAPAEITRILETLSDGDHTAAAELLPLVYSELRMLAGGYLRGERSGHTLQPTALVHEAYLKIISGKHEEWKDRTHFFRVAAASMRHILVNYARDRKRLKRGGDYKRIPLDDALVMFEDSTHDMVSLDDCLTKLSEFDRRMGQVVELRYFGGLTTEETAEILNISKRTVEKDWNVAKLWLMREMDGSS